MGVKNANKYILISESEHGVDHHVGGGGGAGAGVGGVGKPIDRMPPSQSPRPPHEGPVTEPTEGPPPSSPWNANYGLPPVQKGTHTQGYWGAGSPAQ